MAASVAPFECCVDGCGLEGIDEDAEGDVSWAAPASESEVVSVVGRIVGTILKIETNDRLSARRRLTNFVYNGGSIVHYKKKWYGIDISR